MSGQQQKTDVMSMRSGSGPGPRQIHGTVVEKPKNLWFTIKRILKYMGAYKSLLITLLIMVGLGTGISLVTPVLQKDAINMISESFIKNIDIDFNELVRILIMMGIVLLVSAGTNFIQGWVSASLSQKTIQIMRNDLFIKLEKLPVSYFDTHTHGELMSRLTNDIDNISNTLSTGVTSFFSAIITIIGSLVMMLYYSRLMTLICLLIVPVGLIVTKLISKRTHKYFSDQQKTLGELNGHIEEMITGHKTVAAFSREKQSIRQFDKINQRLRKSSINAQIYSGLIGPLMNVTGNLSYALVAIVGGLLLIYQDNLQGAAWGILLGTINIGVIQVFVNLSRQFTRPINELANQFSTILSAVSGAERVFDVMDQIPEPDDGKNIFNLEKLQGHIEFDHVNFGYNLNNMVLKDFTLNVSPGEKIALVGPTGAGKTTIVNLLTRFYEVTDGKILLDGINIKEIPKSNLRSSIGIVLQDTVLFSGTIRDNIRYGNISANDEDVEKAAVTANADTFIRRLPDGYDTILSESGNNLSQGQRQLISIARVILADPKILILDEATSSVDTRTEMNIQRAMIALMEGRTSFIIAHRLSTIRDADVILVIDNGRIAESGSHEDLLEQNGAYRKLYESQFKREEQSA